MILRLRGDKLKIFIVALLIALFFALLFPVSGVDAHAEESGGEDVSAEEELRQNIEDLIANLDIAGLEDYLASLTEEQKGSRRSSAEISRRITATCFPPSRR